MERIVRTKLPVGRIVRIEELEDGTFEVVQKVTEIISEPKDVHTDFILVEAEQLSRDDRFIVEHTPKTRKEEVTRNFILEAIDKKVKNFYRSKCDPSFTDDGRGICFKPGKSPATGQSYNWNSRAAKEYMPERNSRLGTKLEYCAYLGDLIKKLIEEGNSVADAWDMVCNNSTKLANLGDDCKKTGPTRQNTGSRPVFGVCDLGNMSKMLAKDENIGGFWLASGAYNDSSVYCSLATLYMEFSNPYDVYDYSVAWVVHS